MADTASRIRAGRRAAGMTQQELADRSGIRQPNISAIERGQIIPRPETVERLLAATRVRPSDALHRARRQVIDVVLRHRGARPRVFGSVARGEDTTDSDLDLLVTFADDATLTDLVAMADELEALLGVHVDIVDDDGDPPALLNARREAVAL